jgi:hypothetical protein
MTATPKADRLRLSLTRLIHGTGALLAAVSVLAALYCVGGMLGGVIHEGERGSLGWFGIVLAIIIVGLFFGVIFITGRRMYLTLDKNALSDFAFLSAVLISALFYHSMPAHLPKVIADYYANNAFMYPFLDQPGHPQSGPTYRGTLAFITGYLFWRLIKAYLTQVFDLDPVSPKQSADDPDIPEYPNRSSLIELSPEGNPEASR